jgi:peptidoglycan hydrolase-like protein with peptidoglycan-binding domain
MADEMVKQAQRFVNTVYSHVPDIPRQEEDGKTGWSIMYALTRALQYELGINQRSNNFGPGTLAELARQFPVVDSERTTGNLTRIVQSGLYCKGYNGSGIQGIFDSTTGNSIRLLKSNMGVAGIYEGEGVTPKVFKALLTMDAYIVISGGTSEVRSIQQWLNGSYVHRQDYFVVPVTVTSHVMSSAL